MFKDNSGLTMCIFYLKIQVWVIEMYKLKTGVALVLEIHVHVYRTFENSRAINTRVLLPSKFKNI